MTKELGKLPSRYWIQAENGLWFSVARGSEAHKAAETERRDLRLGLKRRA